MNRYGLIRRHAGPWLAVTLLAAVAGPAAGAGFLDYWLTADQQAQRLEAAGDHAQAALRYRDPLRRGVAHYRAGEFEAAADAFGRLDTAVGAFNRGNALILLGLYDDAIASFERALQLRPDWSEVEANRKLAELRKQRREARSDEYQGTDGKLEADEIVFDQDNRSGGQQEQVEAQDAGGSAAEIEALWMRRIQTRPREFLRNKFAYQLQAEAGDIQR